MIEKEQNRGCGNSLVGGINAGSRHLGDNRCVSEITTEITILAKQPRSIEMDKLLKIAKSGAIDYQDLKLRMCDMRSQ
jgi:hypothetical protein